MPMIARRVVTGHDASGRAIVLSDGPPPVQLADDASRTAFAEIWNTSATPAPVSATEREPTNRPVQISPPKTGSIIRFVDFHPGGDQPRSEADLRETFAKYGSAAASTWRADAPHAAMHRTETVDYGIVLEGEIFLVLDTSETRLSAGEVVVQRGTNHAWDNRSDRVCRMAFVLLDGQYDPGLREALGPDH